MELNYIAILIASIVSMVLGMLWYGPVFGKQWMGYAGLSKKDMKKMKLSPGGAMSIGFVATLVTAAVLGMLLNLVGSVGFVQGAALGFWIWLGFALPMTLGAFLWEGKPFGLVILNGTYYLVNLLVMGGILGAF